MAFDFGKITDRIESYKNDVIELQRLLTAIPALGPENDGDGESKKAEALKEYLKKAGFPEPEHYDAPDERVSSKVRPNLVYRFAGNDNSRTVYVVPDCPGVIGLSRAWQVTCQIFRQLSLAGSRRV